MDIEAQKKFFNFKTEVKTIAANDYGITFINNFCDYWGRQNKDGRFKFEVDKFDIGKELKEFSNSSIVEGYN